MIELKVQGIGLDQASKSPVIFLREVDGERTLPIWIGPGEAQAIAAELAGMKFARPLTHDLAASLIRGLGGSLRRVIVSRVQDNTYFAEMVVLRGSDLISIDARPSDSIAIALRMSAPLFISDALLDAAAASVTPADDVDFRISGDSDGAPLSAEELQRHIRKLNPEDLGRFNP